MPQRRPISRPLLLLGCAPGARGAAARRHGSSVQAARAHKRKPRATAAGQSAECRTAIDLRLIKQWSSIMLALMLNSIYREFLRSSLSGMRAAGPAGSKPAGVL